VPDRRSVPRELATVETGQITDFYLRLGADDSLLRAFQNDPHGTLAASGLGQDARAALSAHRHDEVRQAIADEVVRERARPDLVIAPRMYMAPEPEPEPEPGEPEPEPGEPDDLR
jgi:hypothetical protein